MAGPEGTQASEGTHLYFEFSQVHWSFCTSIKELSLKELLVVKLAESAKHSNQKHRHTAPGLEHAKKRLIRKAIYGR